MIILEAALWVSFGLWALSGVWALLNALLVSGLPAEQGGFPLPSLSVVIPARDEEGWIEATVESHCSQDYPDLQVVIVDDCSTDHTPEILGRLQERFPNLHVVRGHAPPEGWLGKPYAINQGLALARGEMVLIADADVRYAPGTHRRAVAEMALRNLDMLVLLPHHEGPWGAELVVMHLDAIFLFGMPSFLYNAPWLKVLAMGAGAGNLLRRAALDEAGGMEALKGEVVDDIMLGRRMKALSGRLRVVKAFHEARVQMYSSFSEACGGFTKNLYAFLGFSPLRVLAACAVGAIYHALPLAVLIVAPVLPTSLVVPAALALAFELTLEASACLWSGHRLWLAPLFPLRLAVWTALIFRSVWRYHQKGLVWRGRVYAKK